MRLISLLRCKQNGLRTSEVSLSPIPFIQTPKNSGTMPEGIYNIDYDAQKKHVTMPTTNYVRL